MKPSPTMEDVARAAGVHQTTVSRALRNDRRLPEATRERIKTLADQMGYRPNPLLSALGANLRQRRTGEFAATLACLVQGGAISGTERAHLAGATAAANEQGYRLEEYVLGSADLTVERLNEVLLARSVQGVIVGPLADPRQAIDLRWTEFCVVSIELTFATPQFDRIGPDGFSGMRRILQECRGRGYRRPGLVLDEATHARSEGHLLAAFMLEAREAGGPPVAPWVIPAWSEASCAAWAAEQQPDVLITTSAWAEPLQAWASAAGRRIGGDLGLAVIDAAGEGPLTGMRQASEAVGEVAVQLLIDKIHRNERGAPARFRTVLTPGSWHEGGTLPARA